MQHILLLTLVLHLVTAVVSAAQDRPNIIWIMADDMGYADAGCYGGQHIATPHIDRLAAEGMKFTQCYAGSPVCAPSRSVLMTGQHTGHTRVRGNFGEGGVRGLAGLPGRIPLRDEDVTVAEVLHQVGYATGGVGKWGLGEPQTSGLPTRQGFDQWFGYLNQRRAHSYYPTFLWKNEQRFDLPGNAEEARGQYSHDLITGHALHFIREHQTGPFFLYVAYTIPHSAFQVPELGAYASRPWSDREKTYAAMITRMDAHLGQLMALLQELDLDHRTIVFFCSDNGAADRYEGRFDSCGPLRGRKRDLYEGGIRTPMIARWPQRIPAGSESETSWYFADLLPTAAAIAGASPPQGVDGVSVLPTLVGKPQQLDERMLYWEFHERGFQQAARWRNWKAIRSAHGADIELYNLSSDLGETHNVARQHPEIAANLTQRLDRAHVKSKEFPIKPAN